MSRRNTSRGSGGSFPSELRVSSPCFIAVALLTYKYVDVGNHDTTLREEQTVDQSLLTVDRQMGLVICTPDGKVSP
jgi:hypothetical protein